MSNVIERTYHENGQIERECYYENDKCHKLDGPAVIFYYENGRIKREYHHIKDVFYHREDFYKHPQVIEYLENKKFYEIVEEVLGE